MTILIFLIFLLGNILLICFTAFAIAHPEVISDWINRRNAIIRWADTAKNYKVEIYHSMMPIDEHRRIFVVKLENLKTHNIIRGMASLEGRQNPEKYIFDLLEDLRHRMERKEIK